MINILIPYHAREKIKKKKEKDTPWNDNMNMIPQFKSKYLRFLCFLFAINCFGLRCFISVCFNSFSYFCFMMRAMLSFKLGKVDTNLCTAPCILKYFPICARSCSVYFLYGPRSLFFVTLETPFFTASKSGRPRNVFPYWTSRVKLYVLHGYHSWVWFEGTSISTTPLFSSKNSHSILIKLA